MFPVCSHITLEICVETLNGLGRALVGGADRLEVCGCLLAGGLTPPASLIEAACHLAPGRAMIMIRPRAGNFCYAPAERREMMHDIELAKRAKARGVVFGVLDAAGSIDCEALSELLHAAEPLDVTFHRAFDLAADLTAALERLVEMGVPRVLTSGGRLSALEGQGVLAELVRRAAGRINVMAGAGVRPDHVAALVRQTGVREIHASARPRPTANPTANRTDLAAQLCADDQPECDAEIVAQLRQTLDEL